MYSFSDTVIDPPPKLLFAKSRSATAELEKRDTNEVPALVFVPSISTTVGLFRVAEITDASLIGLMVVLTVTNPEE